MRLLGYALIVCGTLLLFGCIHASQPLQESTIYREVVPVADPGSTLADNWWQRAVFYQCFVRSFKDSDGDGHGDFNGLTSKLDYLQQLGVTGLWLMPVSDSHTHSNGYDVIDYRRVEADYGSEEDFDTLIKEAHKRNIGVIVDFVGNHSSGQHRFFQDALSRNGAGYKDWYVWAHSDPGWSHPWNPNGDVWHPSATGYYYALFDDFLPDWNYRNPSVQAYMRDSLKWWLNRGVDGFHFDAAHQLFENGEYQQQDQPEDHDFHRGVRLLIDQYEYRFIVAEAPFTGETYLGSGSDEFNSTFCFECKNSLVNGVKHEQQMGIIGFVNNAQAAPAGAQFATMLSNHDPFAGKRMFNELDGNMAKMKLAASVLLTGPGIPFIYYGEEIGMATIEREQAPYDDAISRTPMQWNANINAGFSRGMPWRSINDNYLNNNVEAALADKNSIFHHYQHLIAVRSASEPLSHGISEVAYASCDHDCASYIRSVGDEAVMVVLNLSTHPQTVNVDLVDTVLDGRMAVASHDLLAPAVLHGNVSSNYYRLTLPRYSARLIPLQL